MKERLQAIGIRLITTDEVMSLFSEVESTLQMEMVFENTVPANDDVLFRFVNEEYNCSIMFYYSNYKKHFTKADRVIEYINAKMSLGMILRRLDNKFNLLTFMKQDYCVVL